MYIWNLKKQIQALKNNEVVFKNQLLISIIIIFLAVLSAISYLYTFATESFNTYDIIDCVLFLGINIIGLYWAYRINQKGDQKDFWLRVLMLLLPIGLRVFILTFVLSMLGYTLMGFTMDVSDASLNETNIFDVVVSAITEVYFNFVLISCFKKINNH